MEDLAAVAVESKDAKKLFEHFSRSNFLKRKPEYEGSAKKVWDEVTITASWNGQEHSVTLRGFVSRFSIDLVAMIRGILKGREKAPALAYDTEADDERK